MSVRECNNYSVHWFILRKKVLKSFNTLICFIFCHIICARNAYNEVSFLRHFHLNTSAYNVFSARYTQDAISLDPLEKYFIFCVYPYLSIEQYGP